MASTIEAVWGAFEEYDACCGDLDRCTCFTSRRNAVRDAMLAAHVDACVAMHELDGEWEMCGDRGYCKQAKRIQEL